MADRSKVETAIRYVAEFSLRVQEQKRWIEVLRRQEHPTAQAEALLVAFEDSLYLAKKHLALLWEREDATPVARAEAPSPSERRTADEVAPPLLPAPARDTARPDRAGGPRRARSKAAKGASHRRAKALAR